MIKNILKKLKNVLPLFLSIIVILSFTATVNIKSSTISLNEQNINENSPSIGKITSFAIYEEPTKESNDNLIQEDSTFSDEKNSNTTDDATVSSIEGYCNYGSEETNEGPGGIYCVWDDYEECFNYFVKSTAIAYGFWGAYLGSKTDYCSTNGYTLYEAYLNCGIWGFDDATHWQSKNCNDYDGSGGWNYYCTSTEVRRYENDYGCSNVHVKLLDGKMIN